MFLEDLNYSEFAEVERLVNFHAKIYLEVENYTVDIFESILNNFEEYWNFHIEKGAKEGAKFFDPFLLAKNNINEIVLKTIKENNLPIKSKPLE